MDKEMIVENINWTALFLSKARVTDNPAGDIVEDMKADTRSPRYRDGLPRLFRDADHVRSYLWSRNACQEAIDAVPEFWRRYSAWMKKNGDETAL